MTRREAIDAELAGARKGAGREEKVAFLAREALRTVKDRAEVRKLEAIVAQAGRNAANEHQRTALLKQIIQDDSQVG